MRQSNKNKSKGGPDKSNNPQITNIKTTIGIETNNVIFLRLMYPKRSRKPEKYNICIKKHRLIYFGKAYGKTIKDPSFISK